MGTPMVLLAQGCCKISDKGNRSSGLARKIFPSKSCTSGKKKIGIKKKKKKKNFYREKGVLGSVILQIKRVLQIHWDLQKKMEIDWLIIDIK